MTAAIPRIVVLLLAVGFTSPGLGAELDLPDTATSRFDDLDANRDGVLSKYEYDSEVAFEMMDSDHNASLSAAELQTMLGPLQNGVPSAADRIVPADLDGNGELDDAELRRATEMRFSWLDRNSDGNLDLSELQSGFGVRVRPGD
jgi:Ca2+-binding EF-hand superfamily protein